MRGEWIEILGFFGIPFSSLSLPMRGEWIEIFSTLPASLQIGRLSPCGESGLK